MIFFFCLIWLGACVCAQFDCALMMFDCVSDREPLPSRDIIWQTLDASLPKEYSVEAFESYGLSMKGNRRRKGYLPRSFVREHSSTKPSLDEREQSVGSFGDEETTQTFKEQVETFASSHSVEFVPRQKAFDGKQIYSFGKAKIYLEDQVIFVYNSRSQKYQASSLDELLKLCR